ncbi:hypothetical protein [Hyalangium rubrum]|uniref:4-vinyl reductase 4VR domain-containing protein n=1 Tax=Hyalangium rubrum TaxID=3103134 RepID=A0ABU5GUB3_9BACT|nr:hypothetical protein [Hyalangium sp. s54d21]MDY7224779.1 hypothetical protein [Hyalangium sp. s54d21]
MWNRDDLKQFQVLGANLQNIMGGFGSFTLIASKFLLEGGIGTPDDTMMAQFEPARWYPLDRFLRIFDRIHAEFGNFTLRQVGLHVIKAAQLPPHINDINAMFGSMDVAYHLNHALNEQSMFDLATMKMSEGIGHYKPLITPGTNKITVVADTPYPCPFDEGVVAGAAQKFKPAATIVHDRAACRARNAPSCTYHVSWK